VAKLYANAAGEIVRFFRDEAEERRWPAVQGAAHEVEFDEGANADVVAALNSDWNSFAMLGGVLTRKNEAGVPVPVVLAAPTQRHDDRKGLPAILAKLEAGQNLSAPETRLVLRALVTATRDAGLL
jgi:hypothetical protein